MQAMNRRLLCRLFKRVSNQGEDSYEENPVYFTARIEKSQKASAEIGGGYVAQSTCSILSYDLGFVPKLNDKVVFAGREWKVLSSSLALELFHRPDIGSLPGSSLEYFCPKRIELT